MTQNKARKRAARQRAAQTGSSYTAAAREVAVNREADRIARWVGDDLADGLYDDDSGPAAARRIIERLRERLGRLAEGPEDQVVTEDPSQLATGADPQPAIFDPHPDGALAPFLAWPQLVELIDEAEGNIDSSDPYRQQAGHDSRALLYGTLAAQTTDSVYAAACYRSQLQDQRQAALVRWTHGIPCLFMTTEKTLLNLGACDWCGRPWQTSTDGACEYCPRPRFGPAPHSRQAAQEMDAPELRADRDPRELLHELLVTAIETDGTGCEHSTDEQPESCPACLAELMLSTLARSAGEEASQREHDRRHAEP